MGLVQFINFYRQNDPAAKSFLEVALLYPGPRAILYHQTAHFLYKCRLYFLARVVAETARWLTQIEIHPGATIGKNLFIDHGNGVVIGETAIIGNNCRIYHGVTLGGVSIADRKRHPTLEDDVLIGAGAKILGPVTLGKGCRIGANSVVTKDVVPGDTVAGIPAKSIIKY